MNHGLWLRDTGSVDTPTIVERAVAAEAAGWDGVFVSDSLPYADYPDPWVLLAAIATRTDDIRLGTWVVPVPRRQPWQLAAEVATLDQLSGGRVIFGVGLGNDDEYTAYGRPYDLQRLAARYDESLEIIDGLWGGEPFTYEGEHFSLEAAEIGPTPVQRPRVPILVGCWWPNTKPLHRGARWDGIMPFWASLTGDGTGPHGEEATGTPEEELRAALDYYHGITDEPGDILVPDVPSDDGTAYRAACEELGVTWLLSTADPDDPSHIEAGPPE